VQPFLNDGIIYGFDQKGDLFGVEIPSGKRLFSTPEPISKRASGSDSAFFVKQGERFFFFTEKGDLVIGTLSPKGFKETSRAHLLEPTNDAFGRAVVWCVPAFANKRIYVRNDKEIFCFDLSK
jgi:outer membrane protein assembly factor BamB